MPRRSLLWQFYPPFLFIILFGLLLLSWYIDNSFQKFALERLESELRARTLLAAERLKRQIQMSSNTNFVLLSSELGELTSLHVSILAPNGDLLGDSFVDSQERRNEYSWPEVRAAISGARFIDLRFNPAFGEEALWAAYPIRVEPATLNAIIRTSVPLSSVNEPLQALRIRMLFGVLVILGLTMLASLWVAGRFRNTLEELREGAERFARGELQRKLSVPDSIEMGALALTLNDMARQLNERIQAVVQQRSEREAILSSMEESFLAVDNYHRVLNLNRAAARLFRIQREPSIGRDLHLVVRNYHLTNFVNESLEHEGSLERDLTLRGPDGKARHLQAHGTPLRDVTGKQIGALIVLNDITRLKHLENVRSDFVANVSHELKTPITSIKGAVETLSDGAVEDPETAQRFLNIIMRHADRLNTIINDLLLLSQIEYKEQMELHLGSERLAPLVRQAIQACELKAREKNIQLQQRCPEDLRLQVSPQLIEQALINLIDNAIKYSDPEKTVHVQVLLEEEDCLVRVSDEGCGIDPRHLERLFERFYRVDAARSRKLGGTGLGLAIVKHIMQVHQGRVEVQSQVGRGSVFTLRLPLSLEAPSSRILA
jgi:two-component system phosphate regulon sensor histidine kinase PhoR